MGLREEKKQQLIQQIVDVTVELIEEVGYAAAQVEEIVRRVGISKPTFYRYFSCKDEVLAEVRIRWAEGWATTLQDSLSESDDSRESSTVDRLLRLCNLAAADLLEKEELGRTLYLHAASDSNERVRRAEQQAERGLARLLAVGQQRGDVNPHFGADLLGMIIDSALLAVGYAWAIDEVPSVELESTMRQAVQACFAGLERRSDLPCSDSSRPVDTGDQPPSDHRTS